MGTRLKCRRRVLTAGQRVGRVLAGLLGLWLSHAGATPASASTQASAPVRALPGWDAGGQALPLTPKHLCADLVMRLADLTAALCSKAALVAPAPAPSSMSVRGVPLYFSDVPPVKVPETSLRVLVLGGMHGDELSSVAMVFQWIDLARTQGGGLSWRFVPLLNPDGLMHIRPTRTNANGVDLNRNFPTPDWYEEAPRYWQERTGNDPRRYPGAAPMSEPETNFVLDQIASFRPQLIVALHAPYGILDFDGPAKPPERLGRLYLDQLGVYPGSLGNYAGIHRGVPVVTVELNHALRTPPPRQVTAMWQDLLRWTREHLID